MYSKSTKTYPFDKITNTKFVARSKYYSYFASFVAFLGKIPGLPAHQNGGNPGK